MCQSDVCVCAHVHDSALSYGFFGSILYCLQLGQSVLLSSSTEPDRVTLITIGDVCVFNEINEASSDASKWTNKFSILLSTTSMIISWKLFFFD